MELFLIRIHGEKESKVMTNRIMMAKFHQYYFKCSIRTSFKFLQSNSFRYYKSVILFLAKYHITY